MRTFSAIAKKCHKYKRRARIGIARASAARAAARRLIARLAQCFLKQFHAVCLAGIGATLAMAAVGAHADSIKIGGTGAGLGTMKLMAQEFNKSRPDAQLIVTPSLGSTGAIRAVLAGAVDIGISARPVTPEEQRQGASARAYARTPLVIATGAKNNGAGLTVRELAQIYSGKLTRWPDGSPIRLIVRPDSDADTIAMRAFSAEMNTAMTAALARKGLRMADTDQDNADALEKLPGSLGTTTLTQILSENRAIRPLALDGVAPTLESLAAGRYRYVKTLYLITGRDLSPLAKDFVAFVRSPAGQAVLARSGNLALQE
jgi:phosphate transport system substrate-binding protein